MVKKIITGIIDAISVVMIILAVCILITVVMTKSGQSPSFLGHSAFRVLTGSMEPEIPVDSMVVTQKVDPSEIAVGDIITFYSADPDLEGSVVTHRVARIENDENGLRFITKGDANIIEDEYPVTPETLIGKVVFKSMFFGKLVRLSANPLIFIGFIMIPLVLILVVNLVQTVQTAKEIEQEELGKLADEVASYREGKNPEESKKTTENSENTDK